MCVDYWKINVFQLTPSRRATISRYRRTPDGHFNSRPHGGRHNAAGALPYPLVFQLTPSRRATISRINGERYQSFQLTPSRRATQTFIKRKVQLGISTHDLTEGDFTPHLNVLRQRHFNSRPHGGRLQEQIAAASGDVFQLTPSRRATDAQHKEDTERFISTHALTEGDGHQGKQHTCIR